MIAIENRKGSIGTLEYITMFYFFSFLTYEIRKVSLMETFVLGILNYCLKLKKIVYVTWFIFLNHRRKVTAMGWLKNLPFFKIPYGFSILIPTLPPILRIVVIACITNRGYLHLNFQHLCIFYQRKYSQSFNQIKQT